MRRGSLLPMALFLLAGALSASCGAAPAPTPAEGAAVADGEVIVAMSIPGVVEPENIRLQLDWGGSMVLPFAWGDLPEFTLLDGGMLIYQDERAMAIQLTEAEAQALVQQVLDQGFERLESYTDQCRTIAGGTSLCVYDVGSSRLRLRMPGGELREVSNYADFANDPDALRAMRAFLTEYQNPAARPYVPEKAALYVRAIANPGDQDVLDWPLDPALLTRAPGEENYCAHVVGRGEAEILVSLPKRDSSFPYFRQESQIWEAVLIPWLPGADYAAALASNGLLCPEPTPAASGLADTDWRVTLMEGQVPPVDWTLTLRFTAREVTASAGCNDVRWEYVAGTDGSLSRSGIAEVTLVECREPYASREKAYFHLVRRAVAYRLAEGRLELLDDQGLVILAYDAQP